MAKAARIRAFGIVLTLILGLAVIGAGWAHRMSTPPSGADLAALELLAAFPGDAGDLCSGPGPERLPRGHAGYDCTACRLVGSAVLPDPACAPGHMSVQRALTAALPVQGLPPVAPRHPAWSGRAPPLA